jgi:hypothetical protein
VTRVLLVIEEGRGRRGRKMGLFVRMWFMLSLRTEDIILQAREIGRGGVVRIGKLFELDFGLVLDGGIEFVKVSEPYLSLYLLGI